MCKYRSICISLTKVALMDRAINVDLVL